MKKTLFLALMLMIAATSFAQQQMATLNHNDTISVFYGTYALRDAHNAAVAGDIVTLSPGSFVECDITKPITLRGAGTAIDTIAGTYPTVIIGEFIINIPKEAEHYLTMEGIFLNKCVRLSQSYNAKFTRCNMLELQTYSSNSQQPSVTENIEITNCFVQQFSCLGAFASTSSFNFVNSVVCFIHNYNFPVQFINSLVIMRTSIHRASAYNCIITRVGVHDFRGNSSAYNCIFIKNSNSDFSIPTTTNTNVILNSLNEVFETWHSCTSSNFSFDERYILKEEIATSFLGSDGTEVGIHGGMFPFDTRPSYMVVKKCNVANKSTIDGKLSVDIEVMVEE